MAKSKAAAFKEKQEKAYRDRINALNARNSKAMRDVVRDHKERNKKPKSKRNNIPSVWQILFG